MTRIPVWRQVARAVFTPGSFVRGLFLPSLLILGLLGLLLWRLERSGELRAAKEYSAQQALEPAAFPSGNIALGLRRLGRLYPLPLPEGAVPPRKRRFRRYALSALPPRGAELARIFAVAPEWLTRRVPVVSIQTDPARLEELLASPFSEGDDWEAEGFLAWIENGELAFSSPAGVRLHGGGSREWRETVGYRAYFRRREGADVLPAYLMPGAVEPGLKRLVLRRDGAIDAWGRNWRLTVPLAFDIARQAGLPTPAVRPVALFVNGTYLEQRVATEHLSEDFLIQHFGHADFDIVDTKRSKREYATIKKGELKSYLELSHFVREPARLTLERLATKLDLDNLFRWYVTVLFCATGDRFQGLMVRDLTRPGSPWFYIAWDLDQSFGRGFAPDRPGWETNSLLDRFALGSADVRALILRRTPSEDPAFAPAFTRMFDEVMNYHLTDAFLAERIAHYRQVARDFETGEEGQRLIGDLENFAARREEVLRRYIDELWGTGPSYGVRVGVPAGWGVEVDGHPFSGGFLGTYFRGARIMLRPRPTGHLRFSHWRVGGRRVDSETLEVTVDAPIDIEAVSEP